MHRRPKATPVLLAFACLVALVEGAPASTRGAAATSPRRSLNSEVGSPSELAWQAWLLVDAKNGTRSDLDAVSPLRKLTQKSIFEAPSFQTCAEGYSSDERGRCVKNHNVLDKQAHWNYLANRLTNMFNSGGFPDLAIGGAAESSAANGPLQVSIPLVSGPQDARTEQEQEEEEEEAAVPNPSEVEKAVVTIYEVVNDTKTEPEETFFLGNATALDRGPSSSDRVVSLAEWVEGKNASDREALDYEIPVIVKAILNESAEAVKNITSPAPALILLVSPTNVPLAEPAPTDADDLEVAYDGSGGRIYVKTENATANVTDERIISVDSPLDDDDDDGTVSTTAASGDNRNGDFFEAEGEILKYSEAGMTIPSDREVSTAMPPTEDKKEEEEEEGNVSSEVSINGDFILETTLLDLNTDGKSNSSRRTHRVNATDFRQAVGMSSQPEAALSDLPRGDERAELIGLRSQATADPVNSSSTYSEAYLYDPRPQDSYPDEDRAPEIHTMDERNDYFRPPGSAAPSRFRPASDRVRFPASYARPAAGGGGYVRFPSEEANSIHVRDYKDRSAYPAEDQYASTSTKSSAPVQQKQSYWWYPTTWEQQQQQQQQQRQRLMPAGYAHPRQEHQKPMLLRFWEKMPLLRDPDLYPTVSVASTRGQYSPLLPSRGNFYREMSPRDLGRVFARKPRAPVLG